MIDYKKFLGQWILILYLLLENYDNGIMITVMNTF